MVTLGRKFCRFLVSGIPMVLEWRLAFRLLVLGPLDNENEVVGLEGAIRIRGGWMVLSE